MKDPRLQRRRVLQGAGVGGATLLAGCTNLGSDNGDETEPDDAGDNGNNGDNGSNGEVEPDEIDAPDGDEREVGVIIAPSEEDEMELGEIQQRLQELQMEQVEGGDEEEIQAEMEELQERQQEIIERTVAVASATVSDQTAATVEEEIPAIGGLQVAGDPAELLDLVLADSIAAIVPVEELEVPEEPAP